MSPSEGSRADGDDTPVTGKDTEAGQPAAASSAEPPAASDPEPDVKADTEQPTEPDAGPVPGLATESDATPVALPAADATANRRKVLLFSAAAVVVLVVVGVVVYVLTRGDSADTAGPEVPTIEGSAPPTTQAQAPPAGSTSAVAPQSSASTTAAAGGPDAGAAQSVAEQAAIAISEADVAALVQLSCDPAAAAEGSNEDTFPTDATVEVVGEPQITGDTATVDVRVTLPGAEPATVPMPLTKQGDRWCIP